MALKRRINKEIFKVGENQASVLIQLQKRIIDAPLKAKEETKSCVLIGKEKKDYGTYEKLNAEYFNRQP